MYGKPPGTVRTGAVRFWPKKRFDLRLAGGVTSRFDTIGMHAHTNRQSSFESLHTGTASRRNTMSDLSYREVTLCPGPTPLALPGLPAAARPTRTVCSRKEIVRTGELGCNTRDIHPQ